MLPLQFFEKASQEIEHERSYYRQRSITAETAFLRELDHAGSVISEALSVVSFLARVLR